MRTLWPAWNAGSSPMSSCVNLLPRSSSSEIINSRVKMRRKFGTTSLYRCSLRIQERRWYKKSTCCVWKWVNPTKHDSVPGLLKRRHIQTGWFRFYLLLSRCTPPPPHTHTHILNTTVYFGQEFIKGLLPLDQGTDLSCFLSSVLSRHSCNIRLQKFEALNYTHTGFRSYTPMTRF